jgi:hypothetical protein
VGEDHFALTEEIDYDDSAIIVIEEEKDEAVAHDALLEPAEFSKSGTSPSALGQPIQDGPDAHARQFAAEPLIAIFWTERAHCVTPETATAATGPSFAPLVIRSDETAAIADVENRRLVDEPELQSPGQGQPPNGPRNLPIRHCFREAASEIKRLIEVNAAKRILIAIACEYSSSQRDESVATNFSAAFAFPLALALANDRRILLVDLVSNATCEEVGLEAGPGVLGIISGVCTPAEAVRPTSSPQVDLLSYGYAGAGRSNSVALDSIRLSTAIRSLSREYDLVLIIAAAAAVTGRSRLSDTTDIVLLTAPLGAVTMAAIAEDCTHLKSNGLHPAGVLLLDCSTSALNVLND